MKKEYQEFFDVIKQFRKLRFNVLIQNLNHSDFAILRTIDKLVYGLDPCEHGPADKKTKEKNQIKVSQVTEQVHMNATAVSRSLKSLEEHGFIERTVSPKDRRITFVDITEKGESELQEADEIMNDFSEAVFDKMGTQYLKDLTDNLNRLYQIADQEIELKKSKEGKGRD